MGSSPAGDFLSATVQFEGVGRGGRRGGAWRAGGWGVEGGGGGGRWVREKGQTGRGRGAEREVPLGSPSLRIGQRALGYSHRCATLARPL